MNAVISNTLRAESGDESTLPVKAKEGAGPIPFAYIVSTSFSGSTLLSMLLNAHSRVASIAELANSIAVWIDRGVKGYYCSCGDEIKQCEFWQAVVRHCAEQDEELDLYNFSTSPDTGLESLNRLLFSLADRSVLAQRLRDRVLPFVPPYQDLIDKWFQRNLVITNSILRVTGKQVFVDASKDISRAFLLAQHREFDLKIIHLVRDLPAVFHSFRKRQREISLRRIASYWRKTNRGALRLKRQIRSDQYKLVRYEELCTNPNLVLSELCSFLDVEQENILRRVNEEPHHLIGNKMRTSPFRGIRLNDAWRNELTGAEIRSCQRLSFGLRRLLGYADV